MDCTFIALALLANIGVHLQVVPPVAVRDDLQFPGEYRDGVVYLRSTENCRVVTHEFFHHAQAEQRGPVRSEDDWDRREREARAALE